MISNKLIRIFLFVAIPLVILTASSHWIFEWMWLKELGYAQVFWTLRGTQVILTFIAFVVAAIYLTLNLRYLAGQLKNVSLAGTPFENLNLQIPVDNQTKRIKQIFTIAGIALAVLFALNFYLRWDESLRFFWNMPFGANDPLFDNDIGFYMFQLPFWQLIQTSLISISFLTVAVLVLVYVFTGLLSFSSFTDLRANNSVINHLSLNASIWFVLLSLGFLLDRYDLVLKSDGIVFGAGYTDVTILLPTLWILFFATLALAILFFISRWITVRKLVPPAVITVAIAFIAGQVLLPGFIQKFSVQPNELELETPYLEYNIDMTRLAFNLHKVNEIDYEADDTLKISDIRNNQDAVDNIRLWDPRLLINTYKQLQEIRSYYEFYSVDNDRYIIDGQNTQVMLASREIARRLPSQSDTWVNRHLQFTHGHGLVMSPVTDANRQGEPVFTIKDLPPQSTADELEITNPAIYYGENSTGYYIVNTDIPELHYPDGDQNVYISYDGAGGIPIGNWLKKLFFSWEMGDINIILSQYIKSDSRLQTWRSVKERIRKITPFLHLDTDPYLVTQKDRLYWIQDAYTTSSHFPYSQRFGNDINYIRNSVKIVVDAYNGSVDYYTIDEEDPVLKVYKTIFPDLFKPMGELPAGLQEHFRYPQDLFEVQIQLYNKYHMTSPQVFYNQEDLWTRPNEKYGGRQMLMEPYYVLARLPGEELLEFMLISPLTPENRDNMISWMAAKSDPRNYGDLVVYKLPKQRLIYGPAQIEARIDQDPEISRQIALWDQRGSSVIRGNLMVIPIENSFLYVEPVFLLAEGVDIPQLQRVIVAIGDHISMQPTIEEAIFDIFGAAPGFTEAGAMVSESLVTELTGEMPPGMILSEEVEEIRSLWQDLKNALENGDWIRYGELLNELDNKMNDL